MTKTGEMFVQDWSTFADLANIALDNPDEWARVERYAWLAPHSVSGVLHAYLHLFQLQLIADEQCLREAAEGMETYASTGDYLHSQHRDLQDSVALWDKLVHEYGGATKVGVLLEPIITKH